MPNIVTMMHEYLHRWRIKLYPADNLSAGEGKYFARSVHEAVLNVKDISVAATNRGDYTGGASEMENTVNCFLDETVYQVLDGYSADLGYITLYPKISGSFDCETSAEPFDKAKNPIKIKCRTKPKLRRLIDEIEVLNEGLADTSGRIDRYVDFDENVTNEIFVPGNLFVLYGKKIKIEGDSPNIGLFFAPVDGGAEVKVTRIVLNTPAKIISVAPQTGFSRNRIVIRTQYSGSGSVLLKEPRTITSLFIIEEA